MGLSVKKIQEKRREKTAWQQQEAKLLAIISSCVEKSKFLVKNILSHLTIFYPTCPAFNSPMHSYHEFFNTVQPISDTDYALFELLLRRKCCAKGEILVVPGQVQRELYLVRSGVQMSFYETERKLQVMAFTYPPSLCAIPQSFLTQQPSLHFLTCLTESELDYLTYDDLQRLFDSSRQFERLFRKMTERLLVGVLDRQLELQTLTMEARFLAFCKRSPHLLNLVPHKYLAAYLGIDATNFSKLFNSRRI